MGTTRLRLGALAVACAVMALGWTAPARAGTAVYPAGGGGLSGGLEGWQVTGASCNVALLCSAAGGYDGATGNPAGSLAANAEIQLNLLSLFKASFGFESPSFTVTEGGVATVHVDRRFAPGGLLDLGPQVEYTVRLVDETAATESTPVQETLSGETGWGGVDEVAGVVAGHSYRLAIGAETSSTVINALASGASSAGFDNVRLTVQSPDEGTGGGSGDGGGSGGTGSAGSAAGTGAATGTRTSIRSILRRTVLRRTVIRRNRVFAKVKCPKRLGHACRIGLRGYLGKRAVTTRRNARVGKGRGKRVVLRIKPKFRKRVAKRRWLRFKQTVRVGDKRVVLHKRIRLIRRHR